MTTRLSFNDEELDLLDDMIAYYVMSNFGGGDHSNPDDQRKIRRMQDRVGVARERVGRSQQ